jgi:hypothetical protein
MAISILKIKILECIRSKIRDPQDISEILNVDMRVVKSSLDWLVFKKFITSDGRLTRKGFEKAPVGIFGNEIPGFGRKRFR